MSRMQGLSGKVTRKRACRNYSVQKIRWVDEEEMI